MNGIPWPVPDSYAPYARRWDSWPDWLPGLGHTAARLATDWAVERDGPAMHGWVSMVWPVRDAAGETYVLKLSPPIPETEAEAVTLSTWAQADRLPHRMIVPAQVDLDRRGMLLPRLDANRSLEDHPDIDEAVEVIGDVLSSISGIDAPATVPTLQVDLAAIAGALDRGSWLPERVLARARRTIADLDAMITAPAARLSLLHNDCHFSNVLWTGRPSMPAWVGIDPYPRAGVAEWELTPMLRNRWADAAATGDPDRALHRRVDQVAEIVGLDRDLTRACAQLVAVFNLTELGPDRTDHPFLPPYSVLADW